MAGGLGRAQAREGLRHDPTELTSEEASAYFAEVLRVGRALEAHYRPLKLNFEMRGGAEPTRKLPEPDIVRDAAALRERLRGSEAG